jgi:hypothetical protein
VSGHRRRLIPEGWGGVEGLPDYLHPQKELSHGIRLSTQDAALWWEVSKLICLSHRETCRDWNGNDVAVREGMSATAFDEDVDDQGNRDDLVASGTVDQGPRWLAKHGSRWVLRIDERGVRHESDQ